jgi:hypothetical protein
MAQHIGLQREDEDGNVLAHYASAGIPVQIVDLAPLNSACVGFIDSYGDTVFNQLQLPVLIGELEQMIKVCADAQLRELFAFVITFLVESKGVHQYVRFIGD